MTPFTELEGKALALSPEQRESLAGILIRSLEDEPISDIDEAWLELAETRYTAYKAGERQGIPGGRVFDDIRKELGWARS